MALPSQMARSGVAPARVMGGGRRAGWKARRRRRIVTVLVLLMIGGAGFIFWPDRVNDAQAENASTEAAPEERAEQSAGVPVGMGRASGVEQMGRETARLASTPVLGQSQPVPAPAPRTSQTPTETNVIHMGSSRGTATIDPTPVRATSVATPVVREPQPAPVEPVVETSGGLSNATREAIARADDLLARNRPVEARDVLNRMLHARGTTALDRDELRTRLARIAADLTFSALVVPEDTTATTYTIQSGDALARIVGREGFHTDFRLLMRLNNISDPTRIRVGQRIKALKGPFHAVVSKGAYRLDLYADQKDSAGNRMFLRSFAVGIGELDSETPLGAFRVRQNSKLINPRWVNPRTGEVFAPDDPKNPIGERWIGLEGIDALTESMTGYGIHGTIEPQSIGARGSMGCIRMLEADVELIYEMLVPLQSTVLIVE